MLLKKKKKKKAPVVKAVAEEALELLPQVLAIQGGWTVILILAGCAFWNRNERKLIIQGG